jgi:hypothetical protein
MHLLKHNFRSLAFIPPRKSHSPKPADAPPPVLRRGIRRGISRFHPAPILVIQHALNPPPQSVLVDNLSPHCRLTSIPSASDSTLKNLNPANARHSPRLKRIDTLTTQI